ncbi:MAG: acetyl-CoA carboxylase carboxyltransferase subunit alpha, partial [Allosphingosinicella sp.]
VLGIIDRIVPEPVGGAHRNPGEAMAALGDAVAEELDALAALSRGEVRADRRAKYLAIA